MAVTIFGERRELRIDHEHAVWARQHPNGTAGSHEGIKVARELGGFDLDLAEVLRGRRGRRLAGRSLGGESDGRKGQSCHHGDVRTADSLMVVLRATGQ